MKVRVLAECLVLLVLISGVSGCAKQPDQIVPTQSLLENTPLSVTVTPTATDTLAFTATPSPTVELSACVAVASCPEARAIDHLMQETLVSGSVAQVSFTADTAVRFVIGWPAIDETTLAQNLEHLEWIFSIDGQPYFDASWLKDGKSPNQYDDSKSYPGQWLGVKITGWQPGQTYFIRMGIKLDEPVNNGWQTFEAGDILLYSWFITPLQAPTATPTRQVYPTNTPGAYTGPTNTPQVNLPLDITIKVTNPCSFKRTIVFSGPTTVKFVLDPGQTKEYMAAQGTYTWLVDNYLMGGPQDLSKKIWEYTLPCQ